MMPVGAPDLAVVGEGRCGHTERRGLLWRCRPPDGQFGAHVLVVVLG